MRGKDRLSLNLKGLGLIKAGGKSYKVDELFGIDDDLDKEYREQAAFYAFFVNEMSRVGKDHELAVKKRDLIYAEADEFFRKEFKDTGEKFTEGVIRSLVLQDEEYGIVLEDEIEAKYQHNVMKGVVRAMEQRSYMLNSLGAHKRAEYDMTEMTIKNREYDRAIGDVKKTLREKSKKQR